MSRQIVNWEDSVSVDFAAMIGGPGRAAVRLANDGTVGDHTCKGDFALLDCQRKPGPGNRVIFKHVNGEMYIGRYARRGDTVLLSDESGMLVRSFDEDRVHKVGVILGIFRMGAKS